MLSDRNLLFGILALQNAFVTRDQLIEAMNAWVLERHQPLGDLMRARGALGEQEHALLEALVGRQLARHRGDVEESLHALDLSTSARDALSSLTGASRQTSSVDGGSSLPPVPPPPRRPGAAAPRYRILRPHARGGLGEVYVAEDAELHREVALKEIQPQHAGDSASRGRFLLEAEITGRLEHPGIVPVYGLCSYPDGRPYYAMRFIKGDNLRQAIEQFHGSNEGFGTVAFRQLLRRFLDVCNAIAYAHARGILHRDLKPGNVMLGEFGETVVVDWGLAKVVGRSESSGQGEPTLRPSGSGSDLVETRAGAVVGTPAFMSPEQALGKLDALGPATDIYSLGATLFSVLTGKPSVAEGKVADVLEKVRCGDVPSPRQVRGDVPKPLDAICRKAMAFRPEDRYPSALTLAGDVERWLADEPVSAYRDSIPARAGRWMRKHRTLVATGAAALLVASAGLALGILAVGRLNRKLETVNTQLTEANDSLDAALVRAETERNSAVAVNEFLRTDLLGQADISNQPVGSPDRGRDATITVAELLDRAATGIEGKFVAQPETEAAVRLTIGDAYQALGKFRQALPHVERSLALRRKHLGPEHPSTLVTKNNLATLYADQGKYDEAERLLRELCQLETKLGPDDSAILLSKHNLAAHYRDQGKHDQAEALFLEVIGGSERKYGPSHPNTLDNKNGLAKLYLAQAKYDEAESLLEDVLARREKALGHDHPATLRSKSARAWLLQARGKYGQAESRYLEVVELVEKKLGPDHPDTLSTKNNFAIVLNHLGKYDRAAPLFLEVASAYEKKLGADHPSTLTIKNNVAEIYRIQRRYDQAGRLHEEVLQRRERKLGEDHFATLQSLNNLGLVYQAQQRFDKAEPLLARVARLFEKKLGPDHPNTLITKNNLAKLYEEQEKYDLARPILQQVLSLRESKLGKDHPDTLISKANLAGLYRLMGQPDQALPMLQEVLRQREQTLGADHPATLTSKNTLASLYRDQGKYDLAEPLAREAVAGAVKTMGFTRPQTQAFVRTLVGVYEKWGKPEKAQPILQQQLDNLKEKTGSDSLDTAGAMVELGTNLVWLKKYAEAEPLLLGGYAGLQKHAGKLPLPSRSARTKEVLQPLVTLYEATGNKAEAAKWRKKLDEATNVQKR